MCSLDRDQHCILLGLLSTLPPITKAMQIQCNEGGRRLTLWLANTEHYMTEPKPKKSVSLPEGIPSAALH